MRNTQCLGGAGGREALNGQTWRSRYASGRSTLPCSGGAAHQPPSVRSNNRDAAVEQGCQPTDGWVDVSVLGGAQTGTGMDAPSTKISVRTLEGQASPSKGEPRSPEVWQCRFPSEPSRPWLVLLSSCDG